MLDGDLDGEPWLDSSQPCRGYWAHDPYGTIAGVNPLKRLLSTRRGLGRGLAMHVSALLAVSVLTAIGIGWLLWIALGRPAIRTGGPGVVWTPGDTFDAMKIVLAIVGGVGAVVALTVGYRRQSLAEMAQFIDRFTSASEQLGSDKAAVRLAGVYAMASLADDSTEHRQACIDVMCGYIRMPYTPPADNVESADMSADEVKEATAVAREARQEREVRLTVIRLIGEHLQIGARSSWQGGRFDFTGATLDGGDFREIEVTAGTVLNFANASFRKGVVAFSGARLTGGMVGFGGAEFAGGRVNFDGATISGGRLYLSGAKFSGGAVTFAAASLSGGTVGFSRATLAGGTISFHAARLSRGGAVSFATATFSGALVDFGATTIDGGTVYFGGAEFSAGTVSFDRATIYRGAISFRRAEFSGGTVDFTGALLRSKADQPDEVLRHVESQSQGILLPPELAETPQP